MKNILRICALVAALAVVVFWAAKGAHRGWTQTSIVEMKVDPITEIEFPVRREGFLPGVDLLFLGLAGAFGIFAVSFFVSRVQPRR